MSGFREAYEQAGLSERNGHGQQVSPVSLPLGDKDSRDTSLRAVRFSDMESPGERAYLVEGLIPEGYPTLLHGDGGIAKSTLALSLALAVSSGTQWLGCDVGENAPVLYLDFELDGPEQRRRVGQLARGGYMDSLPNNLLYLNALGHRPREALQGALRECEATG